MLQCRDAERDRISLGSLEASSVPIDRDGGSFWLSSSEPSVSPQPAGSAEELEIGLGAPRRRATVSNAGPRRATRTPALQGAVAVLLEGWLRAGAGPILVRKSRLVHHCSRPTITTA